MGDWRMVSYVHFNPRPPRGGRRAVGAGRNWRPDYFNPRPPRGGRLHGLVYKLRLLAFQSTPPARGGDVPLVVPEAGFFLISIHAPREGGDVAAALLDILDRHFNPRPPRGGRRLRCLRDKLCKPLFQSTPPARGATTGFSRDKWLTLISIHAPREGGDPLGRYTTSTPQRNFNPRPPRGGRRWTETGGCTISGFQSTPPARGATGLDICALHAALISIHAPREGGDMPRG